MSETQKSYQVHGRVTGKDGKEVHGVRVSVWWQHIRERIELAAGEANEDGHFRVRYPVPEHHRGKLLIVIEARSKYLDRPLHSPLLEAQPDLLVNLSVEPVDDSEWATLVASIHPLLEGLELDDIVEDDQHQDVSFLAREIDKTPEQVMRVAVATRLGEAFRLPAAAFYAFVRQRVPASIPDPLLAASQDFSLIHPLVQRIAALIFALSPDVIEKTLRTAVTANIVGQSVEAQIRELVERFRSHRAVSLLTQPYVVGKTPLGDLLQTAKVPKPKQETFARALSANTQSMRNFWRTLGDGEHGFTAAEAAAIERTLSLGAFVKNHLPLVDTLVQRFDEGTYQRLSDLTQLSLQDWIELVKKAGPPDGIDAAGQAGPDEVFARVVYARVTRAFPTAAVAARIPAGKLLPEAVRGPVSRFFQNNPDLELRKIWLGAWLETQGDKAWAGIGEKDHPAVLATVKKVQRLLKIDSNVGTAETLLGIGIHSATQIAVMGRQQFFQKATAAGMAKRQVDKVYESGAHRYAALLSTYFQFNRDAIGIWPKTIGSLADVDQPISEAIKRDSSLATLFGSIDYCAVDSCTSVLSPAAYLCDLLLWLRNHPLPGPNPNALAALDARRPDIRHLLLNCPNSETPLPYIDLVNELLADAISPPVDPNSTINPPWKQTTVTKTAAELRAAPEFFSQQAYVILFGADYPHTLPYSAGLDELRTYLRQSSVPLDQVRDGLLPLHAPTVAQRAAAAAERFGLAPHEVALVTTASFITTRAAWNIPAAQDPLTVLAPIPAFLQVASIDYESLLELLECSWVKGSIALTIQGVDDTCDTSIQSLSPAPLDADLLDRAHRFLRAWRRTGLKMWELDLLLRAAAIANGTLDQNALVALYAFRRLQDATRLPVDAQLAFFQDIDTATHRDPGGVTTTSLYARIFLNPAVTSVAPDADLAALPSGGPIADAVLANHLPAIQAALGVSGADSADLFGLTDNQLTLVNLSLIYRVNALARACKLSLFDLFAVARLLTPAAPNTLAALTPLLASPAATMTFLDQAKAVRQSGVAVDALIYLLTPPAWTTTTQMTDTDIATALEAVRQAILNPNGNPVDGNVIAAVAANAHRAANPGIANDVTALILQLQLQAVGQTLLAVLEDPALTAQPGGVFTPITLANFPNQFLAIQLFDKVAVLVRRLHLVAVDLGWLLANAAVYGGIELANLPVANAQAALALGPLLTTLLLIKLARSFSSAPPIAQVQTLYDLIGGVNAGSIVDAAGAQAALSTITGWPLADIVAFTGALGLVFPGDYKLPAPYDGLRTLEAMATATGATGAQIVSWGAVPADEPAAEAMAASALGALRAKHPSNAEWLALAPSIMDPIRDRRSAALQAYLIGKRDGAGNLVYGDADGLFDHFLIDTQMSSCEVSTRVIQAYIAVQIFVERCLMGLEAPGVVVDLSHDDTWEAWKWMKRYRIWEASRKVFLYPENWLIESQRPTRTELFEKLEQEVHQNENNLDYLETVALNYIDRLDDIAHLFVTGTSKDPVTGDTHVIARTLSDPPRYYHRSLSDGSWSGWTQIQLDIKALQAVPAVYRGRLCLFWLDVKVSNEPRQSLPNAQVSDSPPNQNVAKYATLSLDFSIFRNGSWAPVQRARGSLFDVPLTSSQSVSDSRAIEALYTLKVQSGGGSGSFARNLFVDVFRLHDYSVLDINLFFVHISLPIDTHPDQAVHIGRAVFDGHFSDLELRNLEIAVNSQGDHLLDHAKRVYGPAADALIALTSPDPDLVPEPGLVPKAGALVTQGSGPGSQILVFTSTGNTGQDFGALLNTAPLPFRVVGPATDLAFEPTSYFFFQDSRRCYYVEGVRLWWTGSMWSPVPPSDPNSVPFETRYRFHRFYHPYTRLFWHQLGGGGFPLLFDQTLQLQPDTIDPSGADIFSFQTTYNPISPRVDWHQGRPQDNESPNREIVDFSSDAAYGVYNWELFFHVPLYIAERLSQDQRFEDSLKWFHFLFDPTRLGADPAPKRFWIPKPLYNLTAAEILQQRINNLLQLVNQNDPTAVAQVRRWRKDPFNPFLLADQRPVAYMKRVVMSYLDNLIDWADNLFATDSREALSEATLIYVLASEILGPSPAAIVPPKHADDSYTDLEPHLDAFANALVDIENLLGGGGGGGGGGEMPPPQTFYFKIPPNEKLLGYWKTVADRLYKLRHCQNIKGVTRSLALFDAPIDPGLLIRAQAAGVDIGSVLSDLQAPLPNYRFTSLYTQALDFVNALRAYGTALQSALTSGDAAALAMIQQTTAQQLLEDGAQVLDWQLEQAQHDVEGATQSVALQQAKYDFNNNWEFVNPWEITGTVLHGVGGALKVIGAVTTTVGAVAAPIPLFTAGAAGFGGTPVMTVTEGGPNVAKAGHLAGITFASAGDIAEILAKLADSVGQWQRRKDTAVENAKEADKSKKQAEAALAKAELAVQIAEANQAKNQEQIDNIQQQIDFLTNKFTNEDLYDWMAGQLADVYFQSYRLAYRLCKQLERCYQFELGVPDSSFIQFGYWDSLRKGLLAGETLNHDLRRLQASYLERNVRRFELSRYVSLASLDPVALQQLLVTGRCNFDLPESLFDNDYPGHYNRHLVRVSVSVVYPGAGRFDNVKATLELASNQVRFDPQATSSNDYGEDPVGADPRFVYGYAAAPQKIALGNAQDDAGLFVTAIASNVSDPRYLPFENAGAISSWSLELPAETNDIDLTGIGDVVLHLYYTSLDGGDPLKGIVEQYNIDNAPTSGLKVFSARNDFGVPSPTAANPYPISPWDAFTTKPATGTDPDQTLVLSLSNSKFPNWTRGKTINVTGLNVVALGWNPGNFVLEPQTPLPAADVNLTPVAGVTEPNVCVGAVAVPANTQAGKWIFKLRTAAAADFRSISKNDIGDVLLFVDYQVA